MKPLKFSILIMIVLFTAALAKASAPEDMPRFYFTLDIIGTSQFEDIDHLKNGMMRSEGADRVRVARSSHNFTRIMGTFQGKREDFERDLAGLAQDRFAMKIVDAKDGTVMVTATKLEPLVP